LGTGEPCTEADGDTASCNAGDDACPGGGPKALELATAGFDGEQFLTNGPHQQGTIKIDRSKMQTVVTICSPSLLQVAAYDDVDLASIQKYDSSATKDPLQISVTVFPPTLPFAFASNYWTILRNRRL